MMRNIVVDAEIYERQNFGGISRIFSEILPRMCEGNPYLQFTLLTAEKLRKELPQHPRIQHKALVYWEKFLRPGRYFQQTRRRGRNRAQFNWLQDNQADIWHSTYYTLPGKWQGPVIISAYDLIYERFPIFFNASQSKRVRTQMRAAAAAADTIICISETTKSDFVHYYGLDPAKLQVTHLGISSQFHKLPTAKISRFMERPFILYVGRRSGYKNFTLLAQVYSRWSNRKDIDLVVVGDPWSREELQILGDLGLSGILHLETGICDQELAELYNQALAFVSPSLYEGFGLPLVEAMACGCPVVASRIPSSLEIAADAAFYFEPDSPDELLGALEQAISTGHANSAVQKGVKLAANYSWEKTAKQTLDVYNALLV